MLSEANILERVKLVNHDLNSHMRRQNYGNRFHMEFITEGCF